MVTDAKMTIKQLKTDTRFGPPIYIEGSGANKNSYSYSMAFILRYVKGPYMKIDTEERKDFLKKGTEEAAEKALKELALAARKKTGGCMEIHPSYGAVYGTKTNPIEPSFGTVGDAEDGIGIIIYLTDDRKVTNDDRKNAESNGLGKKWDSEFAKYNAHLLAGRFSRARKAIPPAMEAKQVKIGEFFEYAEAELGFAGIDIVVRY